MEKTLWGIAVFWCTMRHMMTALTQRVAFCAAHYYWLADCSEAENIRRFGLCANRHGHGHNYAVEVTLQGSVDPATGMLMDFTDLHPILDRIIVEPFDHKLLNREVPAFATNLPTLENLAKLIWEQLAPEIAHRGLTLSHLQVLEQADIWVDYTGPTARELAA